MRILVIEDDDATADYIGNGLTQAGHTAQIARNGKDGLFLAMSEPFDVIITDRMLPGPDGLSIVRTLRASSVATPVLVLTALGDVERRVEGLDAGADDYLGKPFAFSELHARVRALSRRPAAAEPAQTELIVGGLRMDLLRRVVTRQGAPIELLPTGMAAAGIHDAPSRTGADPHHAAGTRLGFRVRPHHQRGGRPCQRLRRKLEAPDGPALIRTIRGAGYVLDVKPGA